MTSRSATNPTALRYVTEIQPCQEVAVPKASTRSATLNARLATASAARPISQRLSSDIGGLSNGAPAYNAGTKRSRGCSPCKLNMPPGATPCRTVSATPQPLRPYRPSSNLMQAGAPFDRPPISDDRRWLIGPSLAVASLAFGVVERVLAFGAATSGHGWNSVT